jgi:Na+/melibiose symporter-like transporter
MIGYDALQAVQNESVAYGIKLSVSIYASIPFLVGVASLAFYDIRKATERTIEQELGLRRAAAQR